MQKWLCEGRITENGTEEERVTEKGSVREPVQKNSSVGERIRGAWLGTDTWGWRII